MQSVHKHDYLEQMLLKYDSPGCKTKPAVKIPFALIISNQSKQESLNLWTIEAAFSPRSLGESRVCVCIYVCI